MRRRIKKGEPITEITVKVDVKPGLVLPSQRRAWANFWKKLATQTREQVDQPQAGQQGEAKHG